MVRALATWPWNYSLFFRFLLSLHHIRRSDAQKCQGVGQGVFGCRHQSQPGGPDLRFGLHDRTGIVETGEGLGNVIGVAGNDQRFIFGRGPLHFGWETRNQVDQLDFGRVKVIVKSRWVKL